MCWISKHLVFLCCPLRFVFLFKNPSYSNTISTFSYFYWTISSFALSYLGLSFICNLHFWAIQDRDLIFCFVITFCLMLSAGRAPFTAALGNTKWTCERYQVWRHAMVLFLVIFCDSTFYSWDNTTFKHRFLFFRGWGLVISPL